MNKALRRLLTGFLLAALLVCATGFGEESAEYTDYAALLPLDMASGTAKQLVTVKTYVDGDTTHFFVPESVMPSGVLKARYIAVNTPESTGKIEEYGKKASAFTREKLSGASSILIESEDTEWHLDSTGSRHLTWVWYRTSEDEPYRNLNVELLQNGLAIANSSAQNRYGDVCMAAIAQAKALKLNVYSGQRDPDFYYGDAVELTLREIRTHLSDYDGMKVAFTGVVTMNSNNSVYVESYDPETGLYFGIPVYYGYGLSAAGLDILKVGNESRIVGTLQYYEAGSTYQISGLTYRMMKPKDPGNIQRVSEGHEPAYTLTSADTFVNGQVTIEEEDGSNSFDYAFLSLGTSVEMKNLTVLSAYTTNDEESSSYGAITLTCESEGVRVKVRTAPLRDENGALITQDAFLGKTLDVKGIVDFYDGDYQIKVLMLSGITIY